MTSVYQHTSFCCGCFCAKCIIIKTFRQHTCSIADNISILKTWTVNISPTTETTLRQVTVPRSTMNFIQPKYFTIAVSTCVNSNGITKSKLTAHNTI